MTNEHRRGKDYTRKLPPYEKLKAEYLAGATYRQLAEKYNVSGPAAVAHTLCRRAMRRGEWPLKPTVSPSMKIARVNKDRSINGLAIWELVREYREESGMSWGQLAEKFGVSRKTCYDRQVKYNHKRPIPMKITIARHLLECIGEPIPGWMKEF